MNAVEGTSNESHTSGDPSFESNCSPLATCNKTLCNTDSIFIILNIMSIGPKVLESTSNDASIFSFMKKVRINNMRKISDRYACLLIPIGRDNRSGFPRAKYIPCKHPPVSVFYAKLVYHPLFSHKTIFITQNSFNRNKAVSVPPITPAVLTSRVPSESYVQKHMQGKTM